MSVQRANEQVVQRDLDRVAQHAHAIAALRERIEVEMMHRRAVLLRLNREHGVTVRELAVLADMAFSYVIEQLRRARDEQGITDRHPRKVLQHG